MHEPILTNVKSHFLCSMLDAQPSKFAPVLKLSAVTAPAHAPFGPQFKSQFHTCDICYAVVCSTPAVEPCSQMWWVAA